MFEYDGFKQELQYQLSPIDFMHVSSLFLVSNDKSIRKNDKVHGRKLQKLVPNMHEKSIIDNVSQDPDKVIYNFSNGHLRHLGKLLLIIGINFVIPLRNMGIQNFYFRLNCYFVT